MRSADPPLPSASLYARYTLPGLDDCSSDGEEPEVEATATGGSRTPKGAVSDPLQALEEAATKGDEEAQRVVAKMENYGHVDTQGRTALSILVEKYCINALKELLQRLGDSEDKEKLLTQRRDIDGVGWTVLHRAVVAGPAGAGHRDVVEQLLIARADLYARRGYPQQTPLDYAIREHASEEVLACLFTYYTPGEQSLWEMLQLAARRGNTKCPSALLASREWRAYLDDKLELPEFLAGPRRTTPLHLAARLNFPLLVALFIGKKGNPFETDWRGLRPLHVAAGVKFEKRGESNEEICTDIGVINAIVSGMRSFTERGDGVDLATLTDDQQWTPLHHAASAGNREVIEELYRAYRSEWMEAKDKFGHAPLHLAAMGGHDTAVALLLEKRANKEAKVEGSQHTCMHLASANGHMAIVKLLVEKRAKVTEQDSSGRMPAQLASTKEVMQFLLGGENNAHSSKSHLHLAAQNNHPTFLLWLLEVYHKQIPTLLATVHKDDGRTALHFAAENGHGQIVSILLEHSAQFNRPDKRLHTPLHLAASNGHLKVVEELLQKKAELNPSAQKEGDRCKMTPLHLAVEGGHEEVVRELISQFISQRADLHDLTEPFTLALERKKMQIIPHFLGAHMSMTRDHVSSLVQQECPSEFTSEVFNRMSIPIGELEQFRTVKVAWEDRKHNLGGLAYVSGLLRWVGLRDNTAGDSSDHNTKSIAYVKEPKLSRVLLGERLVHCTFQVVMACPLKDLTSIKVIEALAKAPNQEVLVTDTGYAIVTAAWDRVWLQYWWDLIFKAGVVGVVTWAGYQVRKGQTLSRASTVLLGMKVVVKFLDEQMEIVRLFRKEEAGTKWWDYECFRYIFSLGTLVDWCMMLLDGGMLYVLQVMEPPYDDIWLRSILAACVAANWSALVYATRGFESFGPRLLPILYAVYDTNAFFVVVGLGIVAAANALYVLGGMNEDSDSTYHQALLIVVRLALYGDFDLAELREYSSIHLADDFIDFGVSEILWYAVGIGFTVVGMSLLIGVLCHSYDRHEERSRQTFLQHRAYMYVNMRAGFMASVLGAVLWLYRRLCPCTSSGPRRNEFLGIIRREDYVPDEERSMRSLLRKVDVRASEASHKVDKLDGRMQRLEDLQRDMAKLLKEIHNGSRANAARPDMAARDIASRDAASSGGDAPAGDSAPDDAVPGDASTTVPPSALRSLMQPISGRALATDSIMSMPGLSTLREWPRRDQPQGSPR